MPFRYPVALDLAGRRCVVTGGGRQAEAKARALLEAEADVVVIAPRVTAGLDDLIRRGEITHVRRRYAQGDLAGAFLVIAADTDRAVRAAVFADADANGVLCNAVDDVPHCHFAIPSIVRRGDLLLAISTGGRAPALAKHLRRRLGAQFGWQWEALVEMLGEVRAAAQADGTAQQDARDGLTARAGRWRELLDRDAELLTLLEEGRIDEVRALVYAALRPATTSPHSSGSRR